jgi:hypothetical protein
MTVTFKIRITFLERMSKIEMVSLIRSLLRRSTLITEASILEYTEDK